MLALPLAMGVIVTVLPQKEALRAVFRAGCVHTSAEIHGKGLAASVWADSDLRFRRDDKCIAGANEPSIHFFGLE